MGDCKVKMVEGSYENLKITTMEDLFVMEVILRGNELKHWGSVDEKCYLC